MTERSFAPADPARASSPRPRHPEESPAVVRRYLWPQPPKDLAAEASAQADRAATPEGPRP